MYYVYFLLLSNKNICTGFTSNLRERFNKHKLGKVDSTKPFLPVRLIGYGAYIKKSDAQRRKNS
jgi:putative endonuclease